MKTPVRLGDGSAGAAPPVALTVTTTALDSREEQRYYCGQPQQESPLSRELRQPPPSISAPSDFPSLSARGSQEPIGAPAASVGETNQADRYKSTSTTGASQDRSQGESSAGSGNTIQKGSAQSQTQVCRPLPGTDATPRVGVRSDSFAEVSSLTTLGDLIGGQLSACPCHAAAPPVDGGDQNNQPSPAVQETYHYSPSSQTSKALLSGVHRHATTGQSSSTWRNIHQLGGGGGGGYVRTGTSAASRVAVLDDASYQRDGVGGSPTTGQISRTSGARIPDNRRSDHRNRPRRGMYYEREAVRQQSVSGSNSVVLPTATGERDKAGPEEEADDNGKDEQAPEGDSAECKINELEVQEDVEQKETNGLDVEEPCFKEQREGDVSGTTDNVGTWRAVGGARDSPVGAFIAAAARGYGDDQLETGGYDSGSEGLLGPEISGNGRSTGAGTAKQPPRRRSRTGRWTAKFTTRAQGARLRSYHPGVKELYHVLSPEPERDDGQRASGSAYDGNKQEKLPPKAKAAATGVQEKQIYPPKLRGEDKRPSAEFAGVETSRSAAVSPLQPSAWQKRNGERTTPQVRTNSAGRVTGEVGYGAVYLPGPGSEIPTLPPKATEVEERLMAQMAAMNRSRSRARAAPVVEEPVEDEGRDGGGGAFVCCRGWRWRRRQKLLRVPRSIQCVFCRQVVHFPATLPCHHLACLECLTTAEDLERCPHCRHSFRGRLTRTLGDLTVSEYYQKAIERDTIDYLNAKAKFERQHHHHRQPVVDQRQPSHERRPLGRVEADRSEGGHSRADRQACCRRGRGTCSRKAPSVGSSGR